jgi:hypothetical protein
VEDEDEGGGGVDEGTREPRLSPPRSAFSTSAPTVLPKVATRDDSVETGSTGTGRSGRGAGELGTEEPRREDSEVGG